MPPAGKLNTELGRRLPPNYKAAMNLHFSQILEASCSHNVCPEPSLPGHRTPNPSIRGVGAPMDGLSALPWTARWCQGTLPCTSSLMTVADAIEPQCGLAAQPFRGAV